MLKKYSLSLIALMASCALLAACNKYVEQTDKKIETTLERAEEYLQQAQIPAMPEETDTVRVHNDIWLGNESIKIMEGDTLPAWLEKDDGITIAIAEDATLPDIAQQISDLTNIPVKFDDLKLSESVPEDPVPVRYSGKLSDLLNYLSGRFGVYWQYRDKTINFFATETRIFTIYALPTETNISADLSGASIGDTEGSANTNLSTSADLTLWASIEEGVQQVVGENGQLSFSHSTGTITVTASPYVVQRVARYVNSWNEKLSRQVAITARILKVSLDNTDNYGLNLGLIFNTKQLALDFASPAGVSTDLTGMGALSMTLVKPSQKFTGTKSIIEALSKQGKTRQVTSASVTTMNNKVAPLQMTTSRNYIKEKNVTVTNSSGTVTTEVDFEVDTLTYGITMNVLPRILNHGRLILLFSLNITTLDKLRKAEGGDADTESGDSSSESEEESTTSSVMLPQMTTRAFLQEIAMQSGATLILAGFEDLTDTMASAGIGKAKVGLLGGSSYNNNEREVMVILLTPEILQSPLSPEALMNSQ